MKDKLNLGCGKDIRPDYLNVDFVKGEGVDKVFDLNKLPYPFKDNQFKEILCFNILEHLNNTNLIFDELRRISKNSALIRIIVPHFSCGNSWGNMEHRHPFSMQMFKAYNMLEKFQVKRMYLHFPKWKRFISWFANKFQDFYEYHLAYIFTSHDLHVELEVKK